jgi:hypothetical protein
MSFTAEGTIEIDLAEFWTWVYENYVPSNGAEYCYGVPRTNKNNQTLEIDFAMATYCSPRDWIEQPDAVKQWKDTLSDLHPDAVKQWKATLSNLH